MSDSEKPSSEKGNQEPREDSDSEKLPGKFRGRTVEQGIVSRMGTPYLGYAFACQFSC